MIHTANSVQQVKIKKVKIKNFSQKLMQIDISKHRLLKGWRMVIAEGVPLAPLKRGHVAALLVTAVLGVLFVAAALDEVRSGAGQGVVLESSGERIARLEVPHLEPEHPQHLV